MVNVTDVRAARRVMAVIPVGFLYRNPSKSMKTSIIPLKKINKRHQGGMPADISEVTHFAQILPPVSI